MTARRSTTSHWSEFCRILARPLSPVLVSGDRVQLGKAVLRLKIEGRQLFFYSRRFERTGVFVERPVTRQGVFDQRAFDLDRAGTRFFGGNRDLKA